MFAKSFQSSNRSLFLLFFGLGLILAAPARGQAPVVDPGETHFFNLPDVIEGDCDLFLGPVLATCVVDDIAPLGSPLSSFVVARQRLGRAKSVIHQSHDFKVDATWDSGTVLDALVTGSIDTRGFLLLLGVGQVNVKVVVELLDVTDPMNAFVVTSQTVSSHGLSQGMLPSVGLSLKIEGGAPYIGGGASISVGFGLRMAQEFIRDSDSFSLATKLRRGNTYRLVVKSTSEAKLGASGLGLGASPLGGRAVASFLDPAALADPNLIPANMMREFLDRLEDLADSSLGLNLAQSLPAAEIFDEGAIGGIFNLLAQKATGPRSTIDGVLGRFGISSTDLRGLASEFLDMTDDILNEEEIDSPGVTATRLCVTVEQDRIEVLERHEIEHALNTPHSRVTHALPAEFGGKLEKVFLLVDELIQNSAAAGTNTSSIKRATKHFKWAQWHEARGNYPKAYKKLAHAFTALL